MGTRRQWGAIRELPSRRFQARHPDPDSGTTDPAATGTALSSSTMSQLIGVVLTAGINPATLPWPLPDGADLEDLFR